MDVASFIELNGKCIFHGFWPKDDIKVSKRRILYRNPITGSPRLSGFSAGTHSVVDNNGAKVFRLPDCHEPKLVVDNRKYEAKVADEPYQRWLRQFNQQQLFCDVDPKFIDNGMYVFSVVKLKDISGISKKAVEAGRTREFLDKTSLTQTEVCVVAKSRRDAVIKFMHRMDGIVSKMCRSRVVLCTAVYGDYSGLSFDDSDAIEIKFYINT